MTLPMTVERRKLYTSEEFEELKIADHDNNIYELIDGEIVVCPPPGDEHGGIAQNLNYHILMFDPQRKLGQIRQATRYKVAPGFSPAPDLAFVKAERVVTVVKGAVPVRPDLAVEIQSPHDLETKKRREEARSKIRKYQTGGVPLVWSVNPENKTVEVYHPDQIDPVQVLGLDEQLSGEEVIPGFTLPVRELFENF